MALLAEGVLRQAALGTAGPIIAAAITGTSLVIAAIALPLVVARILTGKENNPHDPRT